MKPRRIPDIGGESVRAARQADGGRRVLGIGDERGGNRCEQLQPIPVFKLDVGAAG